MLPRASWIPFHRSVHRISVEASTGPPPDTGPNAAEPPSAVRSVLRATQLPYPVRAPATPAGGRRPLGAVGDAQPGGRAAGRSDERLQGVGQPIHRGHAVVEVEVFVG